MSGEIKHYLPYLITACNSQQFRNTTTHKNVHINMYTTSN